MGNIALEKKKIVCFFIFFANSKENLIKGVYAADKINTTDTLSGEFKEQVEQELKQNWVGKKMYGQFIREMQKNVDKNKSWQCLSKCDLKVGTEALHVQHRNRPSEQTM